MSPDCKWIYIINKVPIISDHYVLEADPAEVKNQKITKKLVDLQTQINRFSDSNFDCH